MSLASNSQDKLILVIEDEIQVLENTEEILELGGYRTVGAMNGYDGLEKASQHHPDLIICDVMMPKMDGYAVLEAIRDEPQLTLTPFIFLTAKADRDSLRQGMQLGADDYLTKPFTPNDLLTAVTARFARQAAVEAKLSQAQIIIKDLKKTTLQAQGEIDRTEQIAKVKDDLLDQLITQLCDPVSNINMALAMLAQAQTPEGRDRYLKVIQEECQREMQLLNEISELRTLLTPEKAAILQRFKLLQH